MSETTGWGFSRCALGRWVRWGAVLAGIAVAAASAQTVLADDDIAPPLPVGTTVDLSVATVGAIRDVTVADQTLVAIEDNGLWLLQSDGKTIAKVNGPVSSIVVMATDGAQYFIGADEGLFAGRDGAWTSQVSDMISAICVQTDPPLYLAGTHHGMWRSDDGEHWSAVTFPQALVVSCTIAGTYAYAGTSGGVYRSADRGQTWTVATDGIPRDYVSAVSISNGSVYAATAGDGLYVSVDQGATWHVVQGAPMESQDVAVTGATISLLSDGALVESTDGGASWDSAPINGSDNLKAMLLLKSAGAVQ